MQASEHVFVWREADNPGRRAECLRLADLASFVEVGPGDRARGLCRDRVCHDTDNRAEPLAVQGMALFAKQDRRIPADGVGSFEHIGDFARIDLADLTQAGFAWSSPKRGDPSDNESGDT